MMRSYGRGWQRNMNPLSRLAERLGNPLEWHSAQKSIFVLGIIWLLIFGYLAWTLIVLLGGFGPEAVREAHVLPHVPRLLVLLALTTVFLLGSWITGHRRPDSVIHQHVCAQWYTLVLLVLAHFTGMMSLTTGVIFSGAVVVGFMFLNRSVVFGAMAVAVVLHVVVTMLAVNEVIPDGSMLGPSHAPDGSLSSFWVISMYVFTAPQFAVLVGLSYYILTRWRQREAEVRLMSMTDPLTGMANRRAIMGLLKRELDKSRESGLPVSVIMVDLDRFKQLNDTWGHGAGDAALKAAAQVFRTELRQSDHVGRYGGEEFLVVLAGADDHGASLLAERCRKGLEGLEVDAGLDQPLQITASFGLCSNQHRPEMADDELLRAADDALYLAKEHGRNRIEITRPHNPVA